MCKFVCNGHSITTYAITRTLIYLSLIHIWFTMSTTALKAYIPAPQIFILWYPKRISELHTEE